MTIVRGISIQATGQETRHWQSEVSSLSSAVRIRHLVPPSLMALDAEPVLTPSAPAGIVFAFSTSFAEMETFP